MVTPMELLGLMALPTDLSTQLHIQRPNQTSSNLIRPQNEGLADQRDPPELVSARLNLATFRDLAVKRFVGSSPSPPPNFPLRAQDSPAHSFAARLSPGFPRRD